MPSDAYKYGLLKPYIEQAEDYPEAGVVVSYTAEWVAIRDKFPKASFHHLIIARPAAGISAAPPPLSILDLRRHHLPLLNAFRLEARRLILAQHRAQRLPPTIAKTTSTTMEKTTTKTVIAAAAAAISTPPLVAVKQATDRPLMLAAPVAGVEAKASVSPQMNNKASGQRKREEPTAEEEETAMRHRYQVGFHAIPSLYPLHLHVIARDFASPCLKTKHHWQSFTSPFFLPLDAVMDAIERDGHVRNDHARWQGYLKQVPLRCAACLDFEASNFPMMRQHYSSCFAALETPALPVAVVNADQKEESGGHQP